jgi:hypothetical protein
MSEWSASWWSHETRAIQGHPCFFGIFASGTERGIGPSSVEPFFPRFRITESTLETEALREKLKDMACSN